MSSTGVEASPYFQLRKQQGLIIAKDVPKLDLETYIANYGGRTRLDRLQLIGQTSTYYSIDALRLGIHEAKKSKDTQVYLALTEVLQNVAPNDPLATVDVKWVEQTQGLAKLELDRLENELKGYRNNLIKESIRMAQEDVGMHHFATGDHVSTYKSLSRMRDFCTSQSHIIDMSLKIVYTSIIARQWIAVHGQLMRLTSTTHPKPEVQELIQPVLHACAGLELMAQANFRDAAAEFLRVGYASYTAGDAVGGVIWPKQVMTPNDIAIYGGLCALATFTRGELEQRVLLNSDFRQFLELEPHIRRSISAFCAGKYSSCLEILESYRSDYALDLYLQPILRSIYGAVRSKSIVQYFIPFSACSLKEIEAAFPPTEDQMGMSTEAELTMMISSGTLTARIDLPQGLLLAPREDGRRKIQANALAMAKDYERTLKLRLLRINMINAGLEVRAPKGQGGGHGHGNGTMGEDDMQGVEGGGAQTAWGRMTRGMAAGFS